MTNDPSGKASTDEEIKQIWGNIRRLTNEVKKLANNKNIPLGAEVKVQGELLPCPFCGKIPEEYIIGDRPSFGVKGMKMVKCNTSGCCLSGEAHYFVKWNKRAGREPKSK